MRFNSIGILTPPISKSGITPLSNLIDIVCSLSNNIFLFTGNDGYDFFKRDNRLIAFRLSHKKSSTSIKRIFNYILFQIRISFWILKTRKKIDVFIFFIGGDTLIVPMLIVRILRKKVFLLIAGSSIMSLKSKKDPLFYAMIILHSITCIFADTIIVYSNSLIREYSLGRWKRKIVIAPEHSIDIYRFRITKEYHSRQAIVGYVGRFSKEKGILYLLHAVTESIRKQPYIRFLFIGDGVLLKTIEKYKLDNNLSDKIILPGWISHDTLVDYFNQMKLLVIPSDTEGLPNVMLEAMACGTPVLATPVGAIPDIIKDGETGFLLEINSPDAITKSIIRVLNYNGIEKIINNNRHLIENEYTLDKAIERYRHILDNM